jgi:LysM repeat protein
MKKVVLLLFLLLLSDMYGQSKKKDQEVDVINHEVKFGESVRLLSKKYLVDPAEIYKLNKFAVDGISEGMVLKIPVPRKTTNASSVGNTNKESESTVSTEKAPEQKVALDESPKKEQAKTIEPATDIKQIIITEDKTEVNHKVLPKETLYSLARDYNVTVDDIKANNPLVAQNGLQIGQIVKITTSKKVDIKQSTTLIKPSPASKSNKPTNSELNLNLNSRIIKHTVQPKETLYSLSKKYNVSVEQIKEQNAALLINGLQIGQVLEIKPNN